jgi:phage terminase small subunit
MANRGEQINSRQKAFAEEYIIDFNAAQAAKRAGYSLSSGKATTSLLTNKYVIEYLKTLMDERAKRLNLTQDMVVKELMAVAFMNVNDFYDDIGLKPLSELDDNARAALSSYQMKRVKIGKDEYEDVPIMKVHDKMKALEMLSKHLGVFEKDNHQKAPKQVVNNNFNDFYDDDEDL